MFDLITRLRTRSIEYRRKVAFWTTVALTLLITIIWIISLSVRFDDITAAPVTDQPDVPSPFKTFMRQLQGSFSSVKDSVNKNGF